MIHILLIYSIIQAMNFGWSINLWTWNILFKKCTFIVRLLNLNVTLSGTLESGNWHSIYHGFLNIFGCFNTILTKFINIVYFCTLIIIRHQNKWSTEQSMALDIQCLKTRHCELTWFAQSLLSFFVYTSFTYTFSVIIKHLSSFRFTELFRKGTSSNRIET